MFVVFLLYSSLQCNVCGTEVSKGPSRKVAKKQKAAAGFGAATFYTGNTGMQKPAGVTEKARHNYKTSVGDIIGTPQVGTTSYAGVAGLVAYVYGWATTTARTYTAHFGLAFVGWLVCTAGPGTIPS
jgi:hypothetical protein